MNRCADVLAESCTSELARLIRIAGGLELDRLTFKSSLKAGILYDPALSVTILSENSFEVCEFAGGEIRDDSPALAAARVSDFFLGATRVRRQYQTLLQLKAASLPSAWMVVTAYYCAFFASLEICKLHRRISVSCSRDDLSALSGKAVGEHRAAFFQSGHSNFVGHLYAGKLVFHSVGTRPHVAAWQNALCVVREVFGGRGWLDGNHYVSILQKETFSPSAIRNEWNYKRADYYGVLGERRASEFNKIIGSPKSAHGHLCRAKALFNDLDPCVIAILCEVFNQAVEQSSARASEIMNALRR